MADKLVFSLVAPQRELFHGEVDQVDVPGTEGDFGVLANHAPVMAMIRPGALRIVNDGAERRIFVNGGFADVTPAGLTVLAEDALDLADTDLAAVDQNLKDAREDLTLARDDAARVNVNKRIARLDALRIALAR
jgi:F-type H+-transporting ATPase subunit epsilon